MTAPEAAVVGDGTAGPPARGAGDVVAERGIAHREAGALDVRNRPPGGQFGAGPDRPVAGHGHAVEGQFTPVVEDAAAQRDREKPSGLVIVSPVALPSAMVRSSIVTAVTCAPLLLMSKTRVAPPPLTAIVSWPPVRRSSGSP